MGGCCNDAEASRYDCWVLMVGMGDGSEVGKGKKVESQVQFNVDINLSGAFAPSLLTRFQSSMFDEPTRRLSNKVTLLFRLEEGRIRSMDLPSRDQPSVDLLLSANRSRSLESARER